MENQNGDETYCPEQKQTKTKTETNPAIEIVDYTVYATESSIGFSFELALSTNWISNETAEFRF